MSTPRRKWTLGIINDEGMDDVPGTVLLIAKKPEGTEEHEPSELKRSKDGRFVLEPQPDDNPNDPLNWPSWRRDLILAVVGWHCLVGGGQTPILAAGFGDVAKEFNVTFGKVALTTGLFMMGLGVGSLFASPLAIMYGKRPIYLAGTTLFLASSIWCAAATSYESLVVARVLMGIGVSPCECLPSATISEIFFLHERAYRVGIYTLLLLGGKNLVPLAAAAIIGSLGWRWVFWIVTFIVVANIVLIFLFVPESFWVRTVGKPKTVGKTPSDSCVGCGICDSRAPQKEYHSDNDHSDHDYSDHEHSDHEHSDHEHSVQKSTSDVGSPEAVTSVDLEEVAASGPTRAPPKGNAPLYGNPTSTVPKTYVQLLSVSNGRLRSDSYFKALIRPVILFAYPAILWSTVVYALSIGWLIVLSETVAHIYREQPYNFSALKTGLVYLSPFIGGVLGTAVAGKASDYIVRWMARRNNGIYEPEFRLIMGFPVAICTTLGLMGFGWSAEERDKWIVPTIFFGIISFGCCLGSTTAIAFAVDSYKQFAGEALVTLNFSKNIFHGLVFSFFINDWLEAKGSKSVFIWLGVIQMICLSMTVPLYIFGKRARNWTLKKDFTGRWS